MKELNIEGNKKIKLIFKGKILEDIRNINEYSILKLTKKSKKMMSYYIW
jgi:hypothetical protein